MTATARAPLWPTRAHGGACSASSMQPARQLALALRDVRDRPVAVRHGRCCAGKTDRHQDLPLSTVCACGVQAQWPELGSTAHTAKDRQMTKHSAVPYVRVPEFWCMIRLSGSVPAACVAGSCVKTRRHPSRTEDVRVRASQPRPRGTDDFVVRVRCTRRPEVRVGDE